ncbi:MAG: hypothetical protein JXR14_01005 [Paracoccaceae bacterium]
MASAAQASFGQEQAVRQVTLSTSSKRYLCHRPLYGPATLRRKAPAEDRVNDGIAGFSAVEKIKTDVCFRALFLWATQQALRHRSVRLDDCNAGQTARSYMFLIL